MEHTATQARGRLSVRLRPEIKEQIVEAARIRGQSVTDFVVSTLADAAQGIIARQRGITLSARDFDVFLAALDAHEEPNAVLRRAAERYRRNPL